MVSLLAVGSHSLLQPKFNHNKEAHSIFDGGMSIAHAHFNLTWCAIISQINSKGEIWGKVRTYQTDDMVSNLVIFLHCFAHIHPNITHPFHLHIGIWQGIHCTYTHRELVSSLHDDIVDLWHIIMGFQMPSWPLVVVPLKCLCFPGQGWRRGTTRTSMFAGRGVGICWRRGWGWWLQRALAMTCWLFILLWSCRQWWWKIWDANWWAWLWSSVQNVVWVMVISRRIEDVVNIGKVISKLVQMFTLLKHVCVAKGAKRICLQREHMSTIEDFVPLVAYWGGKVAHFWRAIRFFTLVFIVIIIVWGGCPSMLIYKCTC